MTKQELMNYSKEELVAWILRNSFRRPLESDMKHLHIQYLLDKDAELTDKAHREEIDLLEKYKRMKKDTIDQIIRKHAIWEKYMLMTIKNQKAWDKRQKEINKCMEECDGK